MPSLPLGLEDILENYLVCIDSTNKLIKKTTHGTLTLTVNNLLVDIMDHDNVIAEIVRWIFRKKYGDPLSAKGLKRNKLEKSKK